LDVGEGVVLKGKVQKRKWSWITWPSFGFSGGMQKWWWGNFTL